MFFFFVDRKKFLHYFLLLLRYFQVGWFSEMKTASKMFGHYYFFAAFFASTGFVSLLVFTRRQFSVDVSTTKWEKSNQMICTAAKVFPYFFCCSPFSEISSKICSETAIVAGFSTACGASGVCEQIIKYFEFSHKHTSREKKKHDTRKINKQKLKLFHAKNEFIFF